jgi:LmbE family N-acetylglucosaminyl deacetylase
MDRRQLLTNSGLLATAAATRTLAQSSSLAQRKFKFVVTGGHPGDPEYGCGGTVARLTALGHEVVLLYLNNGEWETPASVRMAEARKACDVLKARPIYADQKNSNAIVDNAHYDAFEKLIAAENPDAVLNQWFIDNHPDHRAVANLTYEAWKRSRRKFALYYYEVSDGEDTMQYPSPTHYVDITSVADNKKAACYAHASQSPDRYYSMQDSVAIFRGMSIGAGRAEAFVAQIGSPSDILAISGVMAR